MKIVTRTSSTTDDFKASTELKALNSRTLVGKKGKAILIKSSEKNQKAQQHLTELLEPANFATQKIYSPQLTVTQL